MKILSWENVFKCVMDNQADSIFINPLDCERLLNDTCGFDSMEHMYLAAGAVNVYPDDTVVIGEFRIGHDGIV